MTGDADGDLLSGPQHPQGCADAQPGRIVEAVRNGGGAKAATVLIRKATIASLVWWTSTAS